MEDRRMPLREHLNELRRTLIRSAIVLAALFGVGIVFSEPIMRFVCEPWNKCRVALTAQGARDPGSLVYLGPAEGMITVFQVAFLAAIIVGSPYYLWELWRFVGVGLLPRERRAVLKAFFPGVLLLLSGITFGWMLLLPITLEYLVSFLNPDIAVSSVTLSFYLKFITNLTLVMGFVFETPLIMWAIARAGLMKASTMKKSRRVAFLAIMVFGAAVTPGPDVISMMVVAVPMYVLYEVGLILAARAEAARDRAWGIAP